MSPAHQDGPGQDRSAATVLEAVPVTLFGHDSTSATLRVLPRNSAWRLRKAAIPLAAGILVAPFVALLPPHAPWAVISLVTGGVLARRKWKERYTVVESDAACPRCGAELEVSDGTRLRFPHPVTCAECGHEPVIEAEPPPADVPASDKGR